MAARESEAARIFLEAVEHHEPHQWADYDQEAAAGDPVLVERADGTPVFANSEYVRLVGPSDPVSGLPSHPVSDEPRRAELRAGGVRVSQRIAWRDGRFADAGRFIVTRRDQDRGAFKTPTLRQVAARAPYMHDGSIASLEEVVEYYDRGGNRNPNLDSELQPIGFTGEEKQALVAFLRSLSGVVREGM